MKYYSFFLLIAILFISCSKDELQATNDFKKLEMITQDGDTIMQFNYNSNGKVISVEGYYGINILYSISYINGNASKMLIEIEGNTPSEVTFYYSNGKLDSAEYYSTYYFTFFDGKPIQIHAKSPGGYLKEDAFLRYNEDENIEFIQNSDNQIGGQDQITETVEYTYDDKINPFSYLKNEYWLYFHFEQIYPWVNNNPLTITSNYPNSTNNLTRKQLFEYKYDEDGYPLERRMVSNIAPSSVWKFYYKED